MTMTKEFTHMNTMEIMQQQIQHQELMLAHKVWKEGYPNRFGARIPVNCRWNLGRMDELLQGYDDIEVVEWMKYRWPSGRLPIMNQPARTFKNHKGATDYPQALQKYIAKEKKKGAVLGPFKKIPFNRHVGISPISTRPKKNSEDRGIIVDLYKAYGQ